MNWGLSSLLHVMHICREANLASSSSWMYITYILIIVLFDVTPLLILCFEQKGGEEFVGFVFYFNPFVDDWQKGGEVFGIYMHVLRIYVNANMFCFANRRKSICEFYASLACLSPYICIHVYELYCISICLFEMHELRGSFFEALL